MVSLKFSESDKWTDDGHIALHPLPAAEHCAILLVLNKYRDAR